MEPTLILGRKIATKLPPGVEIYTVTRKDDGKAAVSEPRGEMVPGFTICGVTSGSLCYRPTTTISLAVLNSKLPSAE